MLKHRLITGPLLIAALLLLVVLDNALDRVTLRGLASDVFMGRSHPPRGLLLFAVGLLLAALAAIELTRIFEANQIKTRRWLTAAAAMLGLTLSYSVKMDTAAITAIAIVSTGMIAMFVLALLTFSHDRNVQGVVAGAGAVMFAMVYLGLMFGFLLALRREHSAWWIVGIVLTTKSCDTGAYFTGRAIGRHKMIPWLSPGKTWEGLAGGIAFAAIVGIALAAASRRWLPPEDEVSTLLGLVAGVLFAVVGQFGDLTMSLFKRGAGLKDSSSMLPGLGGVLDVLDSPLMVAPVAFWLFEIA
ncbi:MAG: phosphatidate cytidylyltransferase [Phycisphaerales bacterium]|nr:phosphatidate cytidylyltransferase [Phycisphaerales bacterium]NNM26966.1 phosphatidate cytidylyltransferase [Phycisphaerales bacterium]